MCGIISFWSRLYSQMIFIHSIYIFIGIAPCGGCHGLNWFQSLYGFLAQYNEKTIIKRKVLISHLSLSWLFKGHSKPADVGAGHSYRPPWHTHSTVVVFLFIHKGPGLPAVNPVIPVILIRPIITLHGTVPKPHARVRAGSNNQVGSQAHRVDGGGTQMTYRMKRMIVIGN